MAAAGILAAAFSFWLPAHGQAFCSNRTDILERLGNRYSEEPVAIGLASDGSALEIVASQDGRTWTLIRVWPGGRACILASGFAWTTRLPEYGEQS